MGIKRKRRADDSLLKNNKKKFNARKNVNSHIKQKAATLLQELRALEDSSHVHKTIAITNADDESEDDESAEAAVFSRQSVYKGVFWDTKTKKWKAQWAFRNISYCNADSFVNEIDAARAADHIVKKYAKPLEAKLLNFPTELNLNPELENIVVKEEKTKTDAEASPTSHYQGVLFDMKSGRWQVEREINGKKIKGGSHADSKSAAREADQILLDNVKLQEFDRALLNFPRLAEVQTQSTSADPNLVYSRHNSRRAILGEIHMMVCNKSFPSSPVITAKSITSTYEGVAWDPSRGKWSASRTFNGGKQYHAGFYGTAREAARASDNLVRQFGKKDNECKLNFPNSVSPKISPHLASISKKPSGFQGVFWESKRQKWRAERVVNGVKHVGGHFLNPKQSALISDALLEKFYDGPVPKSLLNFPEHVIPIHREEEMEFGSDSESGGEEPEDPYESKFQGVFWDSHLEHWEAIRQIKGVKYHGGHFVKDSDAARAADDLLEWFSTESINPKLKNFKTPYIDPLGRKILPQTPYVGVFWDSRSRAWRAERKIFGKRYRASGNFTNPKDAALASDQLVVENMYPLDHSRLNFPKEAKLTSGRFVNPIAKAKAEVNAEEENPSVKKEIKEQKQAGPKKAKRGAAQNRNRRVQTELVAESTYVLDYQKRRKPPPKTSIPRVVKIDEEFCEIRVGDKVFYGLLFTEESVRERIWKSSEMQNLNKARMILEAQGALAAKGLKL